MISSDLGRRMSRPGSAHLKQTGKSAPCHPLFCCRNAAVRDATPGEPRRDVPPRVKQRNQPARRFHDQGRQGCFPLQTGALIERGTDQNSSLPWNGK